MYDISTLAHFREEMQGKICQLSRKKQGKTKVTLHIKQKNRGNV